MNNEIFTPISPGRYRIQPSSPRMKHLKSLWPHNQHKILAYMIFKDLSIQGTSVTQKELQTELSLGKGVIFATLKKMINRGHLIVNNKDRPYQYSFTNQGDEYARYVFSNFTKYRIDILGYLERISFPIKYNGLFSSDNLLIEEMMELENKSSIDSLYCDSEIAKNKVWVIDCINQLRISYPQWDEYENKFILWEYQEEIIADLFYYLEMNFRNKLAMKKINKSWKRISKYDDNMVLWPLD